MHLDKERVVRDIVEKIREHEEKWVGETQWKIMDEVGSATGMRTLEVGETSIMTTHKKTIDNPKVPLQVQGIYI